MTVEHTNLYTKYCRVNDAIFELSSSIRDLGARAGAFPLDTNVTLSEIEAIVTKKLNELEDAEE